MSVVKTTDLRLQVDIGKQGFLVDRILSEEGIYLVLHDGSTLSANFVERMNGRLHALRGNQYKRFKIVSGDLVED